MAWGNEKQHTQVTVNQTTLAAAVTNSDIFDTVELNAGEVAHVQAKYTAPASPTDDCVVFVQTAPQGAGSEEWDDEPYMEFVIPAVASAANRKSFTVSGVRKFRVGVYMTGSTDTTGTADLFTSKDGVNA